MCNVTHSGLAWPGQRESASQRRAQPITMRAPDPAFPSRPDATLPLTLSTRASKAAIVPSGLPSRLSRTFLITLPLKCLSSAKLPSPPSRLAWRCPRPADGPCPIAPRTFPAGPESASETAAQTTTSYMVCGFHFSREISRIDFDASYPYPVLSRQLNSC